MNAQLNTPLPTFSTPNSGRAAPTLHVVVSQAPVQRQAKVFRLRGGYTGDNTRAVALDRSIRGRYA